MTKLRSIKTGTWYSVTDGHLSSSHHTLEEAKAELADMKAGYPSKEYMEADSREYWKKVGSESYITKVEEITTLVIPKEFNIEKQ